MTRPKIAKDKERFSPRKNPSQERSRVTVDSIKQATTDLIARDGVSSLTAAKIAQRAGVSTGTFYDYFPNKEAVLLSLFEASSSQVVVAMRNFMAGMLDVSMNQVVTKGIRQLLSLHEEHKPILIDLPKELPELRLTDHPLSFDNLGRGALLIFLQHRARPMSHEEMECKVFFIQQAINGSIRQYLASPPPYLTRQKLISNLAEMIGPYLESLANPNLPTLDM